MLASWIGEAPLFINDPGHIALVVLHQLNVVLGSQTWLATLDSRIKTGLLDNLGLRWRALISQTPGQGVFRGAAPVIESNNTFSQSMVVLRDVLYAMYTTDEVCKAHIELLAAEEEKNQGQPDILRPFCSIKSIAEGWKIHGQPADGKAASVQTGNASGDSKQGA